MEEHCIFFNWINYKFIYDDKHIYLNRMKPPVEPQWENSIDFE